ncbi:hypothetical protein NLK61_03040 [Pseudomonas fuscovaginae UPB0736]|uniref:hypothetical protein n=1 Tax=Pseudomonas asplenii TaxID=53407 RepID=UPI0018DED1DD|nr:hypothetical protein [Pseudomonas fuscovaginae]UUQ65642.1 hypothetical protein NLK61_03040 [Pseudomonas fuscovaginae UPB0736]
MNDVNAWAPYLNHPLTLAAFVVLVTGLVLLGMPKAQTRNRMLNAVALAFIATAISSLLLAAFSESKRHEELTKVNANKPTPKTPEPTSSTNIQMVQGSNNVLINKSESGN